MQSQAIRKGSLKECVGEIRAYNIPIGSFSYNILMTPCRCWLAEVGSQAKCY